MSGRKSPALCPNRRAGSLVRKEMATLDHRQPVSEATWRVYASLLQPEEMQRNFRIVAFSKSGAG